MTTTDRRDATDAQFADELARIEGAPAAVASYLPFTAYEGEYGNGQITHRAVRQGDMLATGCGKRFRDEEASWATWGVGGPLEPGEWPDVNCPDCPQPPKLVVVYDDDVSGRAVQRGSGITGGTLRIGDLSQVLHVTQIAPGRWEQYRVNEHTVDWRYVVDEAAVAGPQRDHDEEGS